MREKDEACREVVSNVDGAVACGIVELASGALLGFHAARENPALEGAIASATLALLRRKSVPAQEAHVISEHSYHFARVLAGGKAAVMLVTKRTASAGIGAAQIRAMISKVEPLEVEPALVAGRRE